MLSKGIGRRLKPPLKKGLKGPRKGARRYKMDYWKKTKQQTIKAPQVKIRITHYDSGYCKLEVEGDQYRRVWLQSFHDWYGTTKQGTSIIFDNTTIVEKNDRGVVEWKLRLPAETLEKVRVAIANK
jgi:hypothetical protein